MRMPEILQGEARTRFLQGIAFGAVAAITIGFFWGGWVTGGTAKTMTAMAETNGRMSVLVPICVAQFTAADGAVAKFKAAGSYSRDNVISEYVKTVAATSTDRGSESESGVIDGAARDRNPRLRDRGGRWGSHSFRQVGARRLDRRGEASDQRRRP